nr:hypothetical protein BaRGS_020889 [Batillaria attramentaria]
MCTTIVAPVPFLDHVDSVYCVFLLCFAAALVSYGIMMSVFFTRDKMSVLTTGRERLREEGIAVSGDLTQRQMQTWQWRTVADKMSVLTTGRESLREEGIAVSGDLTQRQMQTVRDLRRQGKRAYKGGRLIL